MELSTDTIIDHLPYYLSSDQKLGVMRELESFPEKMNYFLEGAFQDEMLQEIA